MDCPKCESQLFTATAMRLTDSGLEVQPAWECHNIRCMGLFDINLNELSTGFEDDPGRADERPGDEGGGSK